MSSAVFAEVRTKARPPPIPGNCGSLSPLSGLPQRFE